MTIKVTVTPEMVEAGKKALHLRDSGLWTRGGESYTVLLTDVYVAMTLARQFPEPRREGNAP